MAVLDGVSVKKRRWFANSIGGFFQLYLYFICFASLTERKISIVSPTDHRNIGNARLQGFETDLGMTGNDYNLALCLFFVTYLPLDLAETNYEIYYL